MSLNKREQFLAGLTVVVVFAGGVYFLLYAPFRLKQELLEQEIVDTRSGLSEAMRQRDKGLAFERRYVEIVSRRWNARSDADILATLPSDIKAVLSASDVNADDIKVRREKKEGAGRHFSVDLVLEGKLPEIMKAMSLLQKAPLELSVEDWVLERKSPEEDVLRCAIVLSCSYISF